MIYFDNSATTRPYPEVIETYTTVAQRYFGNPSSLHGIGMEAERLLQQSRSLVARLLGVLPGEIVFTSGGTEGNNLAVKGTALQYRSRGRHIITTKIEHASVAQAFEQLEQLDFEVTYLPVDQRGIVSVEAVQRAIRSDTILVSVIHVNSETGAVQPVEEIGRLLRAHPKVLFHVDHVQGIGKVPLSLSAGDIDLCTMSGHKFHSVKGTGILFVRSGVQLGPLLSGGQQEHAYRSGTENLAGIVAMTKALRMTLENQDANIKHMRQLQTELFCFLRTIPEAVLNTTPEVSAPHIVNVSFPGVKPEVLVHALEEHGIYVSTKSACSSKTGGASGILLAMGLNEQTAGSAIRISLSAENTMEEVREFQRALRQVLPKLYEVTRLRK
ncbi:cysteine desulfurase family protein [Ectobacillus ponti]|uniref:Cysteine desulfurase n=1 Tax=Ectobacillus ponti TaxID=2961894 RepID=A0AA42BPE5_9BACI|nr:cysteine desulfurase family protein [Ectobacillus ponti]MCP8967464.1 cysteine desulfurase [Ectobacillus ponti]